MISVRVVDGHKLHSLQAGKVQFNFTTCADEDVGSVDKSNGRVYVDLHRNPHHNATSSRL